MIRNVRTTASFSINDLQEIKQQMLTWATPFNICCFLDNQGYPGQPPSTTRFECLLAVGAVATFTASAGDAFAALKSWTQTHQEWLFGHLGYGLAAETEPTAAGQTPETELVVPGAAAPAVPRVQPDPIGFPDLFFFVPRIVIEVHPEHVRIGAIDADPETIWQEIRATTLRPAAGPLSPISFIPRFTRDEYLATVGALQRHILRGDCYEINFCQEFFAQPAHLDPFAIWQALSKASPNPFSAFYRLDERYLCCASPERFLQKTGSTLLSQPIKGTAPRAHDADTDRLHSTALRQSSKDKAENVMVVDLVRNDLAKVCVPGSVTVPELYGVYPFPQVYQMISSVTGDLVSGTHWTEALQACFPMGSMTGAPKHRVVQLIARYERSRRGIFSGAVGYVTPDGDFDFNVVIRSLLYERQNAYLSYQVGSGITWYSDPVAEYEECLLKAAGIKKALGGE